MAAAGLRIDTSIALAGPSSSRLTSASSAAARSSRLRSGSSASTSSSAYSSAVQAEAGPSTSSQTGPRISWSFEQSLSYDDGDGEYVLAMHDYQPEGHNINCLAFRARQIIRVLNRDPSGWWDGEVEGRRGWFPSNYVTCEVGLLTEEELPDLARSQSRHIHSASVASTHSWTSSISRSSGRNETFSRTDHRPLHADGGGTADIYCPPLMRPLLHGLSLLQKAARENRITHYQPSTAFIISCVRAILSDVGCFQRDAPILKRHGILAQERKRILSDLASLVTQARKASDDEPDEELRELEVEAMVRLGGNLFAHVRGLLALLTQCGVKLPARGGLPPGSTLGTGKQIQSSDDTAVQSDDGGSVQTWGGYEKTTNGNVPRLAAKQIAAAPSTPLRAKSMGDLKAQKLRPSDIDVAHMPTNGHLKGRGGSLRQTSTPRPNRYTTGAVVHHEAGASVSSSHSSSSSFSSIESIATPATPVFPSGPATTPEVMEALRYTHDQYLSTIAAFIGHAHSHSRSTHASSTGHMYELIREVVDMVCKLLTIVDAVLRHPELPAAKAAGLQMAKEALYNITGKLVDSVRALTVPIPETMSEEEEKSLILRNATDALRIGADCVAAVKKCLRRATGERPFIVHLPTVPNNDLASPRKFSQYVAANATRPTKSSFHALHEGYVASQADGDDQDLTIQAKTLSATDITLRIQRQSVTSPVDSKLPNPWQPSSPPASLPPEEVLPPLRVPGQEVEADLPSPVSLTHTEDDGTTWEGSHRRPYSPASFDEQVLRGELPAGPEPVRRTPVAWTLTHDHAADDVAYNSDGQLVGATLAALVERMTPHDSVPEQAFASVFFLTFRLFTTPMELVGAIVDRYNITPPAGLFSPDEVKTWKQRKGVPIRLRVSNLVKMWLETHWRPAVDNVALPTLFDFTRDCLVEVSVPSSQKILELIAQWQSTDIEGLAVKADRAREALISLNPPTVPLSEVPRPIMTKNLLNALRQKSYASISITDFDPLELARQMTTMESLLYCAIKPEEVLESGKEGATSPVNVRAVTSMSTAITGFVAESILNELDTKKRTSLVKFFIKVADRCNSLNNFSTLRAILAALDSSTISRLHQTWMGLSQKYKMQLEALRKLSDHARNYHEYRSRLRNTAPPAIPFLGLYLTDVTFCREGNPSFRPSPKSPDKKLLNFNKYHKLARIVQDMQRFQIPYNLKQIPEVQVFLREAFEKSARQGDLQDLYRRSLMVEPKHSTDTPPTSDVRQLFHWTRSQTQTPTPTSATAS
ncbi:hypothetical protein FOMPIDRAFT_1112277 [Fomitopsis schrenkii]|uniref:Ras GEF n=1 Tax=Fomitopsis schrenkii TaxID=2126942 RepID=S8ELR6_FOMSC|nr:hypothetical protein FOMPIDRAFT_1112277 [Fomitopsis schrenkii]